MELVNKTPKRALVLAGGGAKGSYQIGVWRALEKLHWKPDIITGASVGTLNGCLFTMGKIDEAEIEDSLGKVGALGNDPVALAAKAAIGRILEQIL